jgi:hypothetical protein
LVDWLSGYKYGFIPYWQNNWTLSLRFQVSAQPPAKKTAGLIEKETDEVSYKQLKNLK